MGKEFFFGIGLLLSLLAATLMVSHWANRTHLPAEQDLAQAAQSALSGDMEQAVALALRAKERWEQSWTATAAVADQSPMDTVDSLFSQLQVYAQEGNREEFLSACAQLKALVRSMAEAQKPAWWNFL
jgi:hypothetical protein